jgi:AcrR family transcriptional regulator
MPRPAQTARSVRTREALRQAALVRFLAQGVEATSAEQIASDAGVSLRTFYRHFTSKQDLLFADFDAGLHWFRSALAARPADEPVITAVTTAISAFPYDADAVTKIAGLRADELDTARIVRNIRQVEADFAIAVEAHLRRTDRGIRHTNGDGRTTAQDRRLHLTVAARCIAAAVFGAMEIWMHGDNPSLDELSRLCRTALSSLESGIVSDVVSS